MATYDLTSKATAFVNSDSIAALPSDSQAAKVFLIEKTIDIAKMIANGYTMAAGDVFQALEIPAHAMVLFAGAEVTTVFDGTTPLMDIDFAAGDDIVDGGDPTSLGWLASGTNGTAMSTSGTITFTQLVTTTDTIDVVLNAGAADVTAGVLRVVAAVMLVEEHGRAYPSEVSRDQLA